MDTIGNREEAPEVQEAITALSNVYADIENKLLDNSKDDLESAVEAYNNLAKIIDSLPIILTEVYDLEGCDKPSFLIGPDGSEAQQIYEQRVEMAMDKELFSLLSPQDQLPLSRALNVWQIQQKYNEDLKHYFKRMTKSMEKIFKNVKTERKEEEEKEEEEEEEQKPVVVVGEVQPLLEGFTIPEDQNAPSSSDEEEVVEEDKMEEEVEDNNEVVEEDNGESSTSTSSSSSSDSSSSETSSDVSE